MRIEKTGGHVQGSSKRLRRSEADFAVPPEDDSGSAAAPSTVSPAAGISLVGLGSEASFAPPETDDRSAARHGDAMLRAMAGLQVALLDGKADTARQILAALAETMPSAVDQGLDTVLQAVAQRAAVELARAR